MTIETKFNKGEKAFIIENDEIICLPVQGIYYSNGSISYSFITSKAVTSMDKDSIAYKDEKKCFKSIDELSNFHKALLRLRV